MPGLEFGERLKGLSEDEASKRLAAEGYNELPGVKKRGILDIALSVVVQPMLLLLVAAGSLYFLLGDLQEGAILLSFVIVIMVITIFEERRTERALDALRDLSSPRALVVRGGKEMRIAGREVVRGDIMIISEGDRVAADGIVLACSDLTVDESLLTGESVPVRKTCLSENKEEEEHIIGDHAGKEAIEKLMSEESAKPGGEDHPFVYSSTLVVGGEGYVLVARTGANTEVGKIGKALGTIEPEATPLQKSTGRLVKNVAVFSISVAILVVIIYAITRQDVIGGILAGIALAMATIPEEIPVVLTIFLALGAARLSKKKVLVRQMPVVETIGEMTVLCVDKTGTITRNEMAVSMLCACNPAKGDKPAFLTIDESSKNALPEKYHALVEYSILASERKPYDPMEKAFLRLGQSALARTEHLHGNWTLVHEYALSRKLLATSHVWKSPDASEYIVASKGAPESIADLCHFTHAQRDELAKEIDIMAREGLRVLAVAKAHYKGKEWPGGQHDFNFEFLGLVGLSDPMRPDVPRALEEAYSAGIRTIMITGDYPATAQSIARLMGLRSVENVITGQELDRMDDLELARKIRNTNIFARVVPMQKLRIVNALRTNGEVVAMTGDGVNDSPALKSADIGIAMGKRGTDVAREASSIVLLEDDFASIIDAVRLGRRVSDNIRKAVAYIFAIHVPIIGLAVVPVMLNIPLILFPVHIVFLELVIDPASSVAFEAEPEEKNVMKHPPRNPKKSMFGKKFLALSIFQGIIALAITLALYLEFYYEGYGADRARAVAYSALIIANIALITTNLSWSRSALQVIRTPNLAYIIVIIAALAFLLAALTVPQLQALFQFAPITLGDFGLAAFAGIITIVWFELIKATGWFAKNEDHYRPSHAM